MLATPGKSNFDEIRFNGGTAMQHSSIVDECYMTIGAYLDPNLCDKIKRGDYVDFTTLLPQEKASNFQDDKLELIYRNGQTFFVPARD